MRPDPPPPDIIRVTAVTQDSEGPKVRLRGNAVVELTEMMLQADEIDYDRDSGYAEARGNVKYTHFQRSENIEADKVEYNTTEHTGKFYNVRGSAQAKIEARPGVLTTANPFSFTCKWAERQGDTYICHDGVITNCELPNPWWTLRGPLFNIIPGDRAIARQSVFRLRGVPIFYTPYFYKSLKRAPRKSGFLTPNLGNSNRRGQMIGWGYYWALNRSYDATYRQQLFTARGLAHNVDVRGKPSATSDFNFILYGVNDRGRPDNREIKEGGYMMSGDARVSLGRGFEGRADINYLSSFRFRQAFTESIYETIHTQVQSVAYVAKNWSTYSFASVYNSNENFIQADETISIRRSPAVELRSRERLVNRRVLPVWVSFDSSLAMVRRNQKFFQTRRFVERFDVSPRITTSLAWKDFRVTPSFAVQETHYGSSFEQPGSVIGSGLWRSSRDVTVEFRTPTLARVFNTNNFLGEKVKHVIEPRAQYRYVTGVGDTSRIIRFDETELLTDTNQVEYGITNRFYGKRKNGNVDELLSWDLVQQRYFDPTFGGTMIAGQRNINASVAQLTPFSFLEYLRGYSPIVSTLRVVPSWKVNFEWRADYDPRRKRYTNSTMQAYMRVGKWSFSPGHNQLNLPWAKANQFSGTATWGAENREGWSAAFWTLYDYREARVLFSNAQVTYNTDCCGFSVQVRRFNVGDRQEYQYRFALAIANIGSFGTMRRQERMSF